MSFHLAGYTVDLGTTADTDVPAITDDVLTIVNSHFQLQSDSDLLFAAAMSATLNRARIQSPALRQVTPPFIRPIIASAEPPDDAAVASYIDNPLRLRALEEIQIEATSDIATGTERCNALIGISRGVESVPRGDIFTLRGTSTTASVANAWTTITVTWADILPSGVYAIVGLNTIAVTEVASRIILNEQVDRPGSLSSVLVGSRIDPIFRKGRLGVWGRFRSTAMPEIQVLNNGTVSVHTVYLDILRIA